MKFQADMGISPRGMAALRQQGHDALHLQEQDLGHIPDPEILAKARAEGASCSHTIWILANYWPPAGVRARSPSSLRTRRSCGTSPASLNIKPMRL